MTKIQKLICFAILTVLIIGTVFCVMLINKTEDFGAVNKVEDLEGARIGTFSGSIYEDAISNVLNDYQLLYADNQSDLCTMLESNKVQAFLTDEPIAQHMLTTYENFIILDTITDNEYGFAFNKEAEKSQKLYGEFNNFMYEMIVSGTLNETIDRWIGSEHTPLAMDYSEVSDPTKEKVVLGVSSQVGAPFVYIVDGNYVGLDIDIAIQFCEKYGYSLEIEDYTFSGLISAVQSNKADIGAAGILKTEERSKNVLFSDTYYTGGVVIVIKKDALTIEDLEGEKVGVLTGTICDTIAEEMIEDVNIFYTETNPDLCTALEAGKIKAFITDYPIARYMKNEYENLTIIKNVSSNNYGFIFNKDDAKSLKLCEQMNKFLIKIYNDGTLNKIDELWFGTDESVKTIDFTGLDTGENGVLDFYTSTSTGAPFVYMKDGQFAGYDIDIAVRFCREYGYGIKILDSTFGGMLAAVQSGKADFGSSLVTITEERSQKIQFSTPHYVGGIVVVGLDDSIEVTEESDNIFTSFWNKLVDSFKSTFIIEGRWKLFVEGILNTFLLTVSTIIVGTILGFAVYWLSRNMGYIFGFYVNLFSKLISGMPIVVLLMVLFYIIFGSITNLVGFRIPDVILTAHVE